MPAAHAHTKTSGHPARRRIAIALGVVVVVAGVGAAVAARSTGAKVSATPTTAAPAHLAVSTRPLNERKLGHSQSIGSGSSASTRG